MKKFLKKLALPLRDFVQFLIVPYYVRNYDVQPPYKNHLILLYEERLMETSVEYAIKNFRQCLYFYQPQQLWSYTAKKISERQTIQNNELFLEFGTWKGTSINYLSSLMPKNIVYGFDSFEGLKEDWKGFSLTAGHFDLKGQLPKVNSNVRLVKGWFDETLPDFLEKNAGQVLFLHIDCDTYESSSYVLKALKGRIGKGTFILFDEYIGYPNWEFGEYKAFQEFVAENNLKYKYLGFGFKQVLLTIE